MKKPHKVKSQINLTAGDAPEQNTPELAQGGGANLQTKHSAVADNRTGIQTAESKKLKEQEFLSAYEKHQLYVRIRFAAIAVLLIGSLLTGLYLVFHKNDKALSASSSFMSAMAPACMGSADELYFNTSYFPFPDSDKRYQLLDTRVKILDHAIAELDKDGRSAIFARLGAQRMLMKNGERERGLKYGDYLIGKYPGLPSPYSWRAQNDFENGDFANAMADCNQYVGLLERSTKQVQKSWSIIMPKAIWISIDSGRLEDAQRFIKDFDNFGGTKQSVLELKSRMLISKYDSLAVSELKNSEFWSPKLVADSQKLLIQAKAFAEGIHYRGIRYTEYSGYSVYSEKEELLYRIALETGDDAYAQKAIKNSSYGNSSKHVGYYARNLLAKLAISRNKPRDALTAASYCFKLYPCFETALLKARALQISHMPVQAIETANAGLASYNRIQWGQYYLPLQIVKARAMFDLAAYDEAINQCDRVLAQNPHLIEARLIKLRSLVQTKKEAQADLERNQIRNELQLRFPTID